MPYLHHHSFWTVPFEDFPNNNFTDTTVTVIAPNIIEITGWIFYLKQTFLNNQDVIAGYPTPIDPTVPDATKLSEAVDIVSKRSSGDPNWLFLYNFDDSILPPGISPPAKSVRIYSSNNWINKPHGTLRGPYMVSKQAVKINSGDQISFWYRGLGSEDAFDIFGYLLNVNTGSTLTLVDRAGTDKTGATPWTEVVTVVSETGFYKFVFINGSWDFTGGQLTGASMYICRVRVIKS